MKALLVGGLILVVLDLDEVRIDSVWAGSQGDQTTIIGNRDPSRRLRLNTVLAVITTV